jgi:hypothetical protein
VRRRKSRLPILLVMIPPSLSHGPVGFPVERRLYKHFAHPTATRQHQSRAGKRPTAACG